MNWDKLERGKSVRERLARMRPFLANGDCSYVTLPNRRIERAPMPADLTTDQWLYLDNRILNQFKLRAPTVNKLLQYDLRFPLPDSLPMTVEGEVVGQQGLGLTCLPLPFVHHSAEGEISMDKMICSGRRVSEMLEVMLLGKQKFEYDGNAVYGILNHPGLLPPAVLDHFPTPEDVEGWISMMSEHMFFGPFLLIFPKCYSADFLLDCDYMAPDEIDEAPPTLRQKLKDLEGIEDLISTSGLYAGQAIMLQMTPDVARLVVGIDPTLVKWSDNPKEYKVISMIVPQIREDFNRVVAAMEIKFPNFPKNADEAFPESKEAKAETWRDRPSLL
jgi:hypothetical protein